MGRTLDWTADHVGDAYFLALALIAVGSVIAGLVYVLAS